MRGGIGIADGGEFPRGVFHYAVRHNSVLKVPNL
jgi:hypothetical protein